MATETGAAATFGEVHGAEHLPNGAAPVPAARAHMTVLGRGRGGYGDFSAVVPLAKAQHEVRAAYPLVVAVPPDVPEDLRRRLAREGCIVREVHPLNKDNQPGHLAAGYYEGDDINYHSKLCYIIQFPEYVDAARIQALENMDDLFELGKGYAWMECPREVAWTGAPQYKIAYGNEESPDMVAWRAPDAVLDALLCSAAGLVHEPGMPFGEALLGKNCIAVQAAPYSNADASEREHGVTLSEPLLGKNRAARLDAAPYSNPAVFAHPRGMAAVEALRVTPDPPYVVQVSIDEAMGAKAGDPMAVGAKAAGADAGDMPGRGGNLSTFVGIVAASSAVTVVAAGAVSPAVAFGFFVVLLGGLSLVMSVVRGA